MKVRELIEVKKSGSEDLEARLLDLKRNFST